MKTCIDCHFLSLIRFDAADGDASPKTWSEEERRLSFVDDIDREKFYQFHHHKALCYRGMWEFKEYNESKFNHLIKQEDREDRCFWVEHRDGMKWDAAGQLFHVENDNRQLKKSYRYTQIGLWIAAIGAVIAASDEVVLGISWFMEWWNSLSVIPSESTSD